MSIQCDECGGTGSFDCEECENGYVECDHSGVGMPIKDCTECDDDGQIECAYCNEGEITCDQCDGAGIIEGEEDDDAEAPNQGLSGETQGVRSEV